MLAFLKRLLAVEKVPAERNSEPDAEPRASAQLPLTTGASSAEYFTTLVKLQEAISKRHYEEAARLTRENIRQVVSFVSNTQQEYGTFDISSIPALEQGGTMLALIGDDEGLKDMQDLVRSLPELEPWRSTVVRHEEDRRLFAAILAAIEQNSGCLQTDVKEFVGVIAQDVEAAFPRMVTQKDGFIDGAAVTDLRDIDTTPLIYALVNAVKELAARLEALEAAP